MKKRVPSDLLPVAVLCAIAATIGGCGTDERTGDEPPEATSTAPANPTSNPFEHGYTDTDYPRVLELADGVYAYEQIHVAAGETITTVSLIVITEQGVLVADGQESPEETQRLIDTIGEMTDRPITHVVIASDHGDHTGGNSAFPPDAVFMAHPTSAATLEAYAADPNRAADAPPIVLPTDLVDGEASLNLGGRQIEILHLGRAHTGGDLVVYVPDGKVLFMSETYCKDIFPPMRSAYPSEWVAMVERAQAMDVNVYVPGHGVMESPDVLESSLEAFRLAMVQVIEEATRRHGAGMSAEAATAAASFGELETWSLRDSQKPTAMRRVYMELNGELPR